MDNLGDWLYIIMVLIAIVSGLFSGKKKKKNQTDVLGQPGYDTTEERPTNEKSFWELFEETAAGETQPTTSVPELDKPIPKHKKNNKKVSEKVTVRKSETASPFLQGEFTDYGSGYVRRNTASEDEYAIEEETFHDLEELKKAIIYTEILNRKY